MSRELAQALKDLYTERQLETAVNGWEDVPPWVFCSEVGGLLDPDNLRKRVFYGLLRASGLRKIRFHDMRHTFASLLLQQGESPVYVKEQMGHSSIQVTVDLYGYLIPGGNKQAVDRLDEPVGKAHFEGESATHRLIQSSTAFCEPQACVKFASMTCAIPLPRCCSSKARVRFT